MRKMSDRERGAIVEKVEHPQTKRTAEIRLNKRNMEFSCVIGDLSKESKDGGEVKRWALATLKQKEKIVLDWKPVIRAKVKGGDAKWYREEEGSQEKNAEIEIEADRFWIALASKDADRNEVWRWIKWVLNDPESGAAKSPEDLFGESKIFRKPEPRDYGEQSAAEKRGWLRLPEISHGHYLLEYTPELWAGLTHVIDVVENEAAVLDRLLNTKQGRESLVAIGLGTQQLQLTAGSTPPKKED